MSKWKCCASTEKHINQYNLKKPTLHYKAQSVHGHLRFFQDEDFSNLCLEHIKNFKHVSMQKSQRFVEFSSQNSTVFVSMHVLI